LLPHEHFLIAVLPIVGYYLLRYQRFPSKSLIFVIFVGSQFPDLVDKPLAHAVLILPSGRVFIHSLPFAIPICVLAIYYGAATHRPELSGAFVFAYLAHIFTDTQHVLLDGGVPPDLFWPLMRSLPRPVEPPWGGPDGIYIALWTMFSVLILGVALIITTRDVLFQLSNKKI
jgi:hypothetical protein